MRFAGTIWPKKVNIMDWWETKSIVCIYAGRAHSHTRGRYANDRTDGRGAHCVTKYAKIFVHRPFITYYAFWYLHKLLSYLMAYYMMVGFHTCHEVMQLDAWMFTGYYYFFCCSYLSGRYLLLDMHWMCGDVDTGKHLPDSMPSDKHRRCCPRYLWWRWI